MRMSWRHHDSESQQMQRQYEMRKQAEEELLKATAVKLRTDQQSVVDKLLGLIDAQYVGRDMLGDLPRVRPYHLKTVIGGAIFPKPDKAGVHRINIDIPTNGASVAIEACAIGRNQNYMYVHEGEHSFLKVGDTKLPLSDLRAKDGLERLSQVCWVLGIEAVEGALQV